MRPPVFRWVVFLLALLNASMNLSIEAESFRPLNPPILGDFKILVPLKLGGLGGQFIFAFSNAFLLSQNFVTVRSDD